MSLKWQCIVVDCVDPGPLARWWADLLGWRITFEGPDEVVLEPPEGSPEHGVSPDILFGRVPEAKQIKNRLHFERFVEKPWRDPELRLRLRLRGATSNLYRACLQTRTDFRIGSRRFGSAVGLRDGSAAWH